MAVALLNEQVELETCQRMLKLVRIMLDREEQRLTHILLEQDEYQKTFGAVVALREALDALEHEYRSIVNK